MLSKVTPIAITVFSTFVLSQLPTASIHSFFQDIIDNPFNNLMPLMIMAGACAGLPALIIYLVRRHCEKKRAEQSQ